MMSRIFNQLSIFLTFLVLIGTTSADTCGPDEVKNCMLDFLPLLNPEGMNLNYDNLLESCNMKNEAVMCLRDFYQNCTSLTNELQQSLKEAMAYILNICRRGSDFKSGLKEHENCIHGTSRSFLKCFQDTLTVISQLSDSSKWEAECSEYRVLKNCAAVSVRNICPEKATQMVLDQIVHINGVFLEPACKDTIPKFGTEPATTAHTSQIENQSTEQGTGESSKLDTRTQTVPSKTPGQTTIPIIPTTVTNSAAEETVANASMSENLNASLSSEFTSETTGVTTLSSDNSMEETTALSTIKSVINDKELSETSKSTKNVNLLGCTLSVICFGLFVNFF